MQELTIQGVEPVSHEFVVMAEAARDNIARYHPNEAFRAAAVWVPVYLQRHADLQQRIAGGSAAGIFLGLWADQWPGYPPSAHGIIWLFEDGIRMARNTLQGQVYETLEHELGHALGRDHVLDRLRELKAAGHSLEQYVRGECNCDGGH